MKLSTKGKLATANALATIGLIAAAIAWANAEVETSTRLRRHTNEITRSLTALRLVTFEYLLHRHERARVQERGVAERIERLLGDELLLSRPEQIEVVATLRERSAMTQRVFGELTSAPGAGLVYVPSDDSVRRFEGQLTNQLLILQQDNLSDAFRLTDFATDRIQAAQRRVVMVIGAGLLLIAANTLGMAWVLNRDVLRPIRRLRQATSEVAAGNWSFQIDASSTDEIGETARHFDAMTHTLRDSFVQIQRSNQELAALNQEIEAFSYSVSHDLRAPLRSMDGFSLALLEDYGDKLDDEAQDALKRIRAACQRMGRLIDDLLGLSKVTRVELKIKSIDLHAMAREIAQSLQQQQPDRRVEWVIDENLWVQADPALMQIALQNLMENAWKFTGKTDQPVIRVGAVRRVSQASALGEGELELTRMECFVSDNGVGFDMAYADRLFGAFQRLHHESEFPGTGIGLAIVQRIFRRHEAQLWVQARPSLGATFFFSLNEGVRSHEQ